MLRSRRPFVHHTLFQFMHQLDVVVAAAFACVCANKIPTHCLNLPTSMLYDPWSNVFVAKCSIMNSVVVV